MKKCCLRYFCNYSNGFSIPLLALFSVYDPRQPSSIIIKFLMDQMKGMMFLSTDWPLLSFPYNSIFLFDPAVSTISTVCGGLLKKTFQMIKTTASIAKRQATMATITATGVSFLQAS